MLDEPIRIHFGKHVGKLITRIPVGYLIWMVGAQTELWTEAKAELNRRGTVIPELEVSGHAIDRASLKYWDEFLMDETNDNEGLHAWLHRKAVEALEKNEQDAQGRYRLGTMRFVFEMDNEWPVLKTVI